MNWDYFKPKTQIHRCIDGTRPNRVSDQSLPKISFKIIVFFFFYFHYQLPFLHILPPLAIVNCAWYIILYKVPTRENSVPNSESSMKPKFVIQTLLKFKLLSSCCHYCRAMKSILVLLWFLVNEFLNILHYSLIIHLLYS